MRVDRNQPTIDYQVEENRADNIATGPIGIPIRLEIAARIFASQAHMIGNPHSGDRAENYRMALLCLSMADALIEAHNETCEEHHDKSST